MVCVLHYSVTVPKPTVKKKKNLKTQKEFRNLWAVRTVQKCGVVSAIVFVSFAIDHNGDKRCNAWYVFKFHIILENNFCSFDFAILWNVTPSHKLHLHYKHACCWLFLIILHLHRAIKSEFFLFLFWILTQFWTTSIQDTETSEWNR